ncbi:uncharacterized protein LOC143050939 [Mytilus galloprovincialis]|uniref:uncharacterized protein LOC143050939 n=1 Tax=Mytilus galloprovincialis TaxID=29158 RepID=UPI003F7BE41E
MAPLSDEEENYVRLALLLKGVTPRAVRTYFDREFPPTHLPSTLNTNYNTLWDLKLKRIINQAQWNLLIPRNGIPDSKTFDVTLMICLIRNLTSINPPINGFDSLPLAGEITSGSDLARIKYYRNKLAHHDSNTIDSTYFHTAWTDISNAVGRLGGETMYQECKELKVKILDQSNHEIVLEIKQSFKEMKELRKTIDILGTEHTKVTENLRELQSSYSTLKTSQNTLQAEHIEVRESLKDPIPSNIKDQFKRQIEYWEKTDKMFVSTRASAYVMKKLEEKSCVTLTAPSGAGKSFIARHTALVLQKAGYKIVPVRQPVDIRNYYQPGEQTVFIVDDICGNFTVNQQQIENWTQHLPVIETIIADKCCKIIVSCRLQVYKDDKFNILEPFQSCECNLTSDKLCLTSVEKNIIAKKYIGSSLVDIDKLSQHSDFFPLLCSLYNEEKHGDVNIFFENPYIVYENELDRLSRQGDEGKCKKCSLALLVIFNNQLREKWFHGGITNAQTKIIKDTCEACGINMIPKINLKTELDTLVGTFVSKQDGIYRTMHDKLFDILAYYFGQQIIECLIEHGDSELVHERFIWQKSDDENSYIDFIIEIPDDHLELYLERFIKDWLAEKVAVVFRNNNMKVSSFRQQLIQYLQQLDTLQQVKLANTKDTVEPKESWDSGTTPLVYNCYDGYTDMVQWMLHNDVDVDQCRDDGVSGLFMASQEGHTDIVKLLLEMNPNVNLCDNDGSSPLLHASHKGHNDIVKLLLEINPDVNLCDKDGRSPLLQASQNGHTDIVKLLLERNPDVNLCNKNGCSPLLKASQKGHTDIVKLVLERKPDVNLCENYGWSPLIIASDNGHTDIVRLLLERNPDVNLCDNDGCSPLMIASDRGHTDIVRLLLERNPDVNQCNKDGWSPLIIASDRGHTDIVRLLLERNPDVNQCNKDGWSPLIIASDRGHTDIVRLLLERNPDVNQCNKDGWSPLIIASDRGHTDIVRLLLERNPDVNLCNKNGWSPLIIASDRGHTDIVRLLLERNPDVNQCNKDGCSPLLQASYNGHTDIVKLLLERNADVNLCDKDGMSPLIQASYNGHTDIVRLLLERNPDPCNHNIRISNSPSLVQSLLKHKPDIHAQTYDGGNALYFSAKDGNIEITQLLLENNADSSICIYSKQYIEEMINNHPTGTLGEIKQELFDTLVRSKSSLVTEYVSQKSVDYVFDVVAGSSPLHIACFMGRKDIVNCLLDHNATFNQKKEDGTTPLFYACEVGHEDIVQLLLHKGADSQISRLDGKSPLDITKYNGHTSIELILTEYKKMADQLAV